MTTSSSIAWRNLLLATLSFTLSFAAWGLISAFAPGFRTEFHLSAQATALLVAVPVLLGSLARLPAGLLTDRIGGRVMFPLLFVWIAVAAAIVPGARSYNHLVAYAFVLGLAGSSFAIGVGFVSRWFPPDKQGTALGIYGLGNVGHSAAVFLGPLAAARVGRDAVFYTIAALSVVWAVVFFVAARNAPATRPPATLGAALKILATERLAWVLSAFYFLTFGGFVAFSVYLPTLLRDEFALPLTDAGLRTAGFVVLATLMRPVGGILSDHIGGARVLSGVFAGLVPFALLLMWHSMIPFTVGALGCAALLGLGNGAVFKLVPQFFPSATATVTGLVGAMGGLGGFFPPLVLGFFRDRLGSVWPGFGLLAFTAALMWVLNARVMIPRQLAAELTQPTPLPSRLAEQLRAGAWATMATGLLVAAIVVGSRNLQHFDPALVIYTFAVVFATWGIVYHYTVWLNKPPTRRFFDQHLRAVAARRARAGRGHREPGLCHAYRRADVHREAFTVALVDAPAPLLGLHHGGGDHVPAGLRLGALRVGAGRPDDVCRLSLRVPNRVVPHPNRDLVGGLPRPRLLGRDGARRHRAGALAAAARSRRACRAGFLDGSSCRSSCCLRSRSPAWR